MVRLTANGSARADVRPGEPFRLDAEISAPAGGGTIVAVEWDLDGSGTALDAEVGVDGTRSTIRVGKDWRLEAPGTYFPSVRVTSHRDGDVHTTQRRLVNLGRVARRGRRLVARHGGRRELTGRQPPPDGPPGFAADVLGTVAAVKFRKGARLDTSQVRDVRGRGGGGGIPGLGGGGLRIPTGRGGMAAGGGIVGLIVVVVVVLLSGALNSSGVSDPTVPLSGGDANDLSDECQTGADANQREDCRIVAVVNSVQDYWTDGLRGYQEAETVLFTDQVSTACGGATSAVGPFYCPADQRVYIDLGFFDALRATSARAADRSRRPTSSRTSTATTCRTSWARPTAATGRGRGAGRCASSCRPTAMRACGLPTRPTPS